MNDLLGASALAFCSWLEARLPAFGPDWWKSHVTQRLSFQQQRSVQERRITSLRELDLAALLRIVDQNWHELSAREALPKEARTWIKELQNVRNRWAHVPSGGLDPQDAYRDVDTLGRVLEVIDAPSDLIDRASTYKSELIARIAPTPAQAASAVTPLPPGSVGTHGQFSVGQLVCLRSNPDVIFPVLEIMPATNGETRYRVFENGARQTYYESQLRDLSESTPERKVLTKSELSALLTSTQLNSPSATALYSFNSGRVQFVPYQYRPIFKLIRADRPRLLIADEVGVGKTIEAGLILKELQARNDIQSVLIICPKSLVAERKWEREMKRFDVRFTPLDGPLLRHCIRETHAGGEWPPQHEKAILPFSLIDQELLVGKPGKGRAREVGLLELDPPPKFDLVIVDEAHHIRNTETYLHQAVRYFCDHAEAVVFLSATPVQLGRDDLFTLLNTLRPDLIIDQASFNQMAEPNPYINEAIEGCRQGQQEWAGQVRQALEKAVQTDWGRHILSVSPDLQTIYDALAEDVIDDSSRVRIIQALENLYTFSSLINRTRRRDIGEFTTRKPETIAREFTPGQKAFHDRLLDVIARILTRLHGNQNVKFMMTTIRRQAASSLYGLAPMLEDILNGKIDQLEVAESGDTESFELSSGFIKAIQSDVSSLLEQARQLDAADPKADAFLSIVVDKLGMPNNKLLVFSTFLHTLSYLAGELEKRSIRFGLVHGDVDDAERSELRRRFALPKESGDALDVLLSSEVGCEGLDFQFCDCLVNYDLPWNPMRIEQRIGRIDRYGQQSETIAIFNLITPGTVDAEIYDRCLSRIGVFQHAIGGNEEILGDIAREIHSISDSFALSDGERAARLQQLADNKIRLIEEEKRLEERQGELFGLNLASAGWDAKLKQSRSCWLEPPSLATTVEAYLGRRLGKEQGYLLGDKPLKTLRLSQDARQQLLDDLRKIPRSTDPIYRDWERWLKGASPTLQVTFEQDCAADSPNAVLLSLRHPLLRQAAHYLQESTAVYTTLELLHSSIASGQYPFAIYRWSKQGVRPDEELIGVAADPEVTELLFDLLETAETASEGLLPNPDFFDALDEVHHRKWQAAAARHSEENRLMVESRIQSLSASHSARRALLQDQVSRATNEKIRIMKQAEFKRAESDFSQRIARLEQAASGGDIRATPIIFGVLNVGRQS